MNCPLPFMLDRSFFMSHQGLSRCSATAREVWLEVLEECFCTASLHVTCIEQIAKRKDVPMQDVLTVFQELSSKGVCALTLSGLVKPTNAEYLAQDFWQRTRPQHHESYPS